MYVCVYQKPKKNGEACLLGCRSGSTKTDRDAQQLAALVRWLNLKKKRERPKGEPEKKEKTSRAGEPREGKKIMVRYPLWPWPGAPAII